MIQLIQTPLADSVLLDGNNTLIKIKSSRGSNFYFRARIYIDDKLFDEQGWSRDDEGLARKNFLNLYQAYFSFLFEAIPDNGITEQIHLIKKIKIEIDEKDLDTDNVIETIALPEYYIMYNNQPHFFDANAPITLLDFSNPVVFIPIDGLLRIPFFVNIINSNISVKIFSQSNSLISNYTTDSMSGKKAFLFHYNMTTTPLDINDLYFKIQITNGINKIEKRVKIFRNPSFVIKKLTYLNLFGYYVNAYFDGRLEVANEYTINDYLNNEGQEIVSEISSLKSFSLNSGSLTRPEIDLLHHICTALDVKLEYNTILYPVSGKTKKSIEFKDKENLFSTEFKFTKKSTSWIDNLIEINISIMNPFEITVNENEIYTLLKTEVLEHFIGDNSPTKIRFINLKEGELGIITDSGAEVIILDKEYELSEILNFTYLSGDIPKDSLTYPSSVDITMFNGTSWTNFAKIGITILKVITPIGHAPVIVIQDIKMLKNSYGYANFEIQGGFSNYISDFKMHDLTVSWSFVDVDLQGVEIVNPKEKYITLKVYNNNKDSFQLKVIAVCTDGGKAEHIVNVNVYASSIKIKKFNDTGWSREIEWHETHRDFEAIISGGVPGATIDVVWYAGWKITQSDYNVYANLGKPNQYMFPYPNQYKETLTFEETGTIVLSKTRLTAIAHPITWPPNLNFQIYISNPSIGIVDLVEYKVT